MADGKALYDAEDIAWVLTSTGLVLLMVPGISLFYSGLARRKSALSLLFIPILSATVALMQWFLLGFSLVFGRSAKPVIGTPAHAGFRDTLDRPSIVSDTIPDLLLAIYQSMFAAVTVAILAGAVAERGHLLPCLVFCFVWTTLVYDPVAFWTWNPSGWAYTLGSRDFAGGTPVHVVSGAAALAYSFMLGPRKGRGTSELTFRPHNTTLVVIGTTFLWVGWAGFNGGSALAANMRAIAAVVAANIAALDAFSAIGFCSGVVAGLVAVTPGSGYIPPWAAVMYGIIAGTACNFATKIKFALQVDDALDIFALHAIGGLVGDLLTGIFSQRYIAALDGATMIKGGWIDGHWAQIGYQVAAASTGFIYSFSMTCAILLMLSYVPGMALRMLDDEQTMGADEMEIGEFGYDYVELERDVASSLDTATHLRPMSEMGCAHSCEHSVEGLNLYHYGFIGSGSKHRQPGVLS